MELYFRGFFRAGDKDFHNHMKFLKSMSMYIYVYIYINTYTYIFLCGWVGPSKHNYLSSVVY